MMVEIPAYPIDAAAAVNLVSGLLVVGIGGAVLLYERFSVSSVRLAVLTSVVGAVQLCASMVELTGGHQATGIWFQRALAMDALLAPAIYGLALQLVNVRRERITRLAWLLGGAVSVWSLSSPALMLGVMAIARRQFVWGGAWAGTLFVLFLAGLIVATVVELAHSYRRAIHADDRRRALTLAAGFGIGALGMIDFFVQPQPFGAGITPFAVAGAILVFGYAAIRYRAFSPLPSFATDRILQVMGDGVLLCDREGRVRNANRSACDYTGKSEHELVGVQVDTLFADVAVADAVGLPPETRDRELALVRPCGGRLEVSVSRAALRQRSAVVGSVVVFRDISERLRAARALNATEQRYNSLFWNNPSLAFEIDRAGNVIQANPAVERTLGLSADALRTRRFTDFVHAEDVTYASDVFRRVLSGGAESFRVRLSLPHSTVVELRGGAVPVVRDGEIIGVFGVGLDITEEERVRRELELQRMEFAALFEGSPEAIVITDDDDVVIRINPEFSRTFDYTTERAVGRKLDDLLVPVTHTAESVELAGAARRGEVVKAETVRQRSDGVLIEVSVLARELRLPGQPPQMYWIYRDITDRMQAERSLKDREEELRHAQRLESIGKLAGGVAHDFNNLVTVINGHVGFAIEALPAKHAARFDLEQIEHAGRRAANLTHQLLAFSRRQLLTPEAVDAAVVIIDVRKMLDRLIGEHINFETSLADDVHVLADRGQLEQLLVNLVVNARDAMPEGGRLTIGAARTRLPDDEADTDGWDVEPGDYVRISVTDTGIGMDAQTLARAFDPFFTTKERGKGTGLGLASVFGTAKQSGGHVAALSEPGRGTTIQVWLPSSPCRPAPECAEQPPSTGIVLPRPGRSETGRVLIVEDEAALRELAARVLRRAGHDVLLAVDGEEALDVLERHPVDLVLSDLIMPRMGGRELVRRVRMAYPQLPIMLMSGYDDEVAGGQLRETILSKPFTPAELAEHVAQAMNSTSYSTCAACAFDVGGSGVISP